jgi:DNA-binding response OmpR family regulator
MRAGHRIIEADDATAARALIGYSQPTFVALDSLRPEAAGFELCRWIRGCSELPVIMLMAPGDRDGRMMGFELGADDCVERPCSPHEVAARVRAILRRTGPFGSAQRIQSGPLLIDAGSREVARDGRSLRLTAREFDLLWFLAGHPELVFSRRHLLDRVWGGEEAFGSSTVTVHVRRLREKIERDPSLPRHLQTIRGVGYRFVPQPGHPNPAPVPSNRRTAEEQHA